ncbi:putative F-box protein At5g52610 [Carex rostrata]
MANQEAPLQTDEQPSEQTEQLNNDLTKKILICVPAISLLRFQLVCKNWAAMIQEPQFKKDHFEPNNTTNEPLRLLVVKEGFSSGVFCENSMVVDVDNLQRRKIWIPRDLGSDGDLAGSCNGLLCTEVKGEITVFNPITRDKVSLPKPIYIRGYEKIMHTDLLFHYATGEYKVMFFYQNASMPVYAVNMYTLGANSSWRQVNKIRSFPSNSGVNVDDTIYWPSFSEDFDAIISFDISKEEIEVQPLFMPDESMLLGLAKWDNKLYVVSLPLEHQIIKLWTVNNLKESVFTLRYEILLQGTNGDVEFPAPYSIEMNKLFLATSDTIFYHDLSGKPDNVIKVMYSSSCEIKNCFAYVESLLPVPN